MHYVIVAFTENKSSKVVSPTRVDWFKSNTIISVVQNYMETINNNNNNYGNNYNRPSLTPTSKAFNEKIAEKHILDFIQFLYSKDDYYNQRKTNAHIIYIFSCFQMLRLYYYIHIVFMCLQIYKFTNLHIYIFTYSYIYIFTNLQIYIFIYLHIYIFTYLHIYIFTHSHTLNNSGIQMFFQ